MADALDPTAKDWLFKHHWFRVTQRSLLRIGGVMVISDLLAVRKQTTAFDVRERNIAAFKRSSMIDAYAIDIKVNGDTVKMSSKLHNWNERHSAEKAGWCAPRRRGSQREISARRHGAVCIEGRRIEDQMGCAFWHTLTRSRNGVVAEFEQPISGASRSCTRVLPVLLFLGASLMAGCVATESRHDLASPTPVFKAERFFIGHSKGQAELRVVMSRARKINVRSFGRIGPGGTLILDQIVEREGSRPASRQWRLIKLGGGRYTGSLTGARGPVTGLERGNSLRLRYTMKNNGLQVEQWIYLAADGRSASNQMTIRKYGVTLAALDETIQKTD